MKQREIPYNDDKTGKPAGVMFAVEPESPEEQELLKRIVYKFGLNAEKPLLKAYALNGSLVLINPECTTYDQLVAMLATTT